MPIADGAETIMPQLVNALQLAKLEKIVSTADILRSATPAGAVARHRAPYILTTPGCEIKVEEFPALYRYARRKFRGLKREKTHDAIAEFMRLADHIEEASRKDEQRCDIAGTKFGQLLRTPKLMRPDKDFELVSGVHYIVRRSTDRSTYMVGCVNVIYNPEIQHGEWTLLYFSAKREIGTGRYEREIHGLVTEHHSNFHFFGFANNSTRLHAINVHSSEDGVLCGVALTRDGHSMSGSRAVLVRPPKSDGFEDFDACVRRLATAYEVRKVDSTPATRADSIKSFVATLEVGHGDFLDNFCKTEGVLRSVANES